MSSHAEDAPAVYVRRHSMSPNAMLGVDPDAPGRLLTYTERVMCQPLSMDDLFLHRATDHIVFSGSPDDHHTDQCRYRTGGMAVTIENMPTDIAAGEDGSDAVAIDAEGLRRAAARPLSLQVNALSGSSRSLLDSKNNSATSSAASLMRIAAEGSMLGVISRNTSCMVSQPPASIDVAKRDIMSLADSMEGVRIPRQCKSISPVGIDATADTIAANSSLESSGTSSNGAHVGSVFFRESVIGMIGLAEDGDGRSIMSTKIARPDVSSPMGRGGSEMDTTTAAGSVSAMAVGARTFAGSDVSYWRTNPSEDSMSSGVEGEVQGLTAVAEEERRNERELERGNQRDKLLRRHGSDHGAEACAANVTSDASNVSGSNTSARNTGVVDVAGMEVNSGRNHSGADGTGSGDNIIGSLDDRSTKKGGEGSSCENDHSNENGRGGDHRRNHHVYSSDGKSAGGISEIKDADVNGVTFGVGGIAISRENTVDGSCKNSVGTSGDRKGMLTPMQASGVTCTSPRYINQQHEGDHDLNHRISNSKYVNQSPTAPHSSDSMSIGADGGTSSSSSIGCTGGSGNNNNNNNNSNNNNNVVNNNVNNSDNDNDINCYNSNNDNNKSRDKGKPNDDPSNNTNNSGGGHDTNSSSNILSNRSPLQNGRSSNGSHPSLHQQEQHQSQQEQKPRKLATGDSQSNLTSHPSALDKQSNISGRIGSAATTHSIIGDFEFSVPPAAATQSQGGRARRGSVESATRPAARISSFDEENANANVAVSSPRASRLASRSGSHASSECEDLSAHIDLNQAITLARSVREASAEDIRGSGDDESPDGNANKDNTDQRTVDAEATFNSNSSIYPSMHMCHICERMFPAQDLEMHSDFCLVVNHNDVRIFAAAKQLREALAVIMVPFMRYAKADLLIQISGANFENKFEINDRIFDGLGPIVREAQKIGSDSPPSYTREYVASLESSLDFLRAAIAHLKRCNPNANLVSATDEIEDCASQVVAYARSGMSALQMLAPNPESLADLAARNTTGTLFPTIDSFEVIKPLSQGNFGQVLLARKREEPDAYYAIKVLQRGCGVERNELTAEQQILARTNNDFVVKLVYSFETEGNYYFVMEYMSGGDTLSLLQSVGAFSDEMTQAYAAEIVLALEYLHNMGIVHRDLKPDNIMIGADGHLQLTDFGLSSFDTLLSVYKDGHENEGAPREREMSAVGTPDYVAPEVLQRRPHGPPVDWWALGVIIYEFTTGCPPFNDESAAQVFRNILDLRIEWPEIPDEMSLECQDLISKLLVLDPKKRLTAEQVKAHPYFEGIEWGSIKESEAIWVPEFDDVEDTSYFDPRGANKPVAMDSTPLRGPVSLRERLKETDATINRPGKTPTFAFKNLAALDEKNAASVRKSKRNKGLK